MKRKNFDPKVYYPFGSDLTINFPEVAPELFFHCSSYGRQVYLIKRDTKYKVCIYHFFNSNIPHNTIEYEDTDFCVSHRDDLVPTYETQDFKDAVSRFYETAYRLIVDDDVMRKGNFYL